MEPTVVQETIITEEVQPGQSHKKQIAIGAGVAAAGVAAGIAGVAAKKLRKRKHRDSSASSVSDEDLVVKQQRSYKNRAAKKLSAAVGAYLLKNQFGANAEGGVGTSSVVTALGSQVLSDPAAKAALQGVAERLLLSKYKAHKHSKYSSDVVGESDKAYKNKEVVKTVALSALPLILTQVKNITGKEVTVDAQGRPQLDMNTLSAVTSVAKKFIRGQVGSNLNAQTVTTTTVTEVPSHHHHHHEKVVQSTYVDEVGTHHHSSHVGQKAAAARIARKVLRRKRTASISSASSSSDGGKVKKFGELAVGAGVARHLVTKLNRRSQRKALKKQVLVETEPSKKEVLASKLAAYRARSSSSSSSSDDEGRKRKAALRVAATSVARKLAQQRVRERNPGLTEQELAIKYNTIETRLARDLSSASSSDEEAKVSGKNKAALAAASFFVRHQLKKRFRKEYRRPGVVAEKDRHHHDAVAVTTASAVDAIPRKRRSNAARKVAALGTSYFLNKTTTHKHQLPATTKSSKLRVRSSSSSSSSSSDEEHHKVRDTAALVAGATVAKKMVHKLNRRQARRALKKQILVEQDPVVLGNLKARHAELVAISPIISSASSSDEESHAKRNFLLASATAVAGYLLKERLENRRAQGVITETVYQEKLGGIDRTLAKGSLSSGYYGNTVGLGAGLGAGVGAGLAGTTAVTTTTTGVGAVGLNNNPYTSSSSEDQLVAKQYRRRSHLLPAQALVNRLISKNYRRQYPRRHIRNQTLGVASTVSTVPNTGIIVERERPRAWVRAANGIALSLLRETNKRSHYKKEKFVQPAAVVTQTPVVQETIVQKPVVQEVIQETIVQKPVVQEVIQETYVQRPVVQETIVQPVAQPVLAQQTMGVSTNPNYVYQSAYQTGVAGANVGAGLGVGLGTGVGYGTTVGTGLGTGLGYGTTVGTGLGTGVATGLGTGLATGLGTGVASTILPGRRQYEMVDAAVKVKKHGIQHLVYEDLGYFVTLKIDYDYLYRNNLLTPGQKLKNLLKLRNENAFSLDRAVDEPTKQVIKQSLGLDLLDNIRLEYAGAAGGIATSSSSASSGLEDTYVTPQEAQIQNLSRRERMSKRFHRRAGPKTALMTTTPGTIGTGVAPVVGTGVATTTTTYGTGVGTGLGTGLNTGVGTGLSTGIVQPTTVVTTDAHVSTMDKLKNKLFHH